MNKNISRFCITSAILFVYIIFFAYKIQSRGLPWSDNFDNNDHDGWTVVGDQPNTSSKERLSTSLDEEPNDTPDTAFAIAVGDTLTASFYALTDVDWYKFHLDVMHMYYFTSIENDAGVAPDLALYFENDLQNNLLNSSVAGRNGNNNFRLAGYLALKTGNYYAKITNIGNVLGAYKIRLVGGRSISDFMVHEADNSISNADAQAVLTADETLVYGVLFPVNDFDYYHFEGTAGWKCTVGTEPILDLDIRDTDTYIYLLDSEGNVLSENDDRGTENTPSGPTNNTFSELSERLPYTGSYYVKVRSFYNSVEGSSDINHGNPSTGEYGLLLTLEEPTGADFFEKGPYLQNVTQTSITIMWETLYADKIKNTLGAAIEQLEKRHKIIYNIQVMREFLHELNTLRGDVLSCRIPDSVINRI